MSGFKNIILSRKGFDSSTGGNHSLFEPDTGKYIVLPIPEREKDWKISNPLRFQDVGISDSYSKRFGASNLKELMVKTDRWKPIINRGEHDEEKSEYAHLDPWLGHCPWLSDNSNHNIGAFGQVGNAQAHLKNREVGKGSLFLFFSRFKPIHGTKMSKFCDVDISSEHLKEGLYFIYGWLRVGGEPIKCYNDPQLRRELKEHHPHATQKYFEECKGKNNTIYIADKYLFNNSTGYLGYAYFPTLTKDLLLTASDSAQKPDNWIPTRWELPGFFHEHKPTYLHKEWRWRSKVGSLRYLVQIPGRGQEFVFDDSEEFCQWLNKLVGEIHEENHRNKW
jgi:hypothetical protein